MTGRGARSTDPEEGPAAPGDREGREEAAEE